MARTTIGILLFIFLAMPSKGIARDIKEVVSTSPSWNTFTNTDGTGLYHDILRVVFALYDIPTRHEYSKSSRSEELVILGQADMMTCDDMANPPLTKARYPMYVNDFYVFFKRERIVQWKGVESLKDKEILSQPTYYSKENFSVPVTIKDVLTGHQALAMIIMDRSDFYVDDLSLIQQSIKDNTVPFDWQDFDIQKAGRRSYHPLFNITQRGQRIMKLYEEGIMRLHKSGKLKPIYDKWGYQYPDFDSY